MTRFTFHARQVERYRDRRIQLAGDAAHPFPAPGVPLAPACSTPSIGTFAPDLTLGTDRGATSVAALMHAARPVFLDLADRADLRETIGLLIGRPNIARSAHRVGCKHSGEVG